MINNSAILPAILSVYGKLAYGKGSKHNMNSEITDSLNTHSGLSRNEITSPVNNKPKDVRIIPEQSFIGPNIIYTELQKDTPINASILKRY